MLNRATGRVCARIVRPRAAAPLPIRSRHALVPLVRALEPRLVLNATAELNPLGQLVISGGQTDDYVRLDVNDQGEIYLEDAWGDAIEIQGHPRSPADPLDPSAITSGQIRIDLGSGNDTLDLTLPSGLDVTLIDGEGTDAVQLLRPPGTDTSAAGEHTLAAESIRFDPGQGTLDWSNQTFRLRGDVFLGQPDSTHTILFTSGDWQVDGRVVLLGDLNWTGSTGSLDLSAAALTTDAEDTLLRITLDPSPASRLQLGGANDSGGFLIHDLVVDSASSVDFGPAGFSLSGTLQVDNVTQQLSVSGELSAEQIDLQAGEIRLHDARLTTRGGDLTVDAPTLISGRVIIQSADDFQLDRGGDVRFTGTLDAVAGSPAILEIDSRGILAAGQITLDAAIGSVSPLAGVQLSGGAVTVDSIAVDQGEIRLLSDALNLRGPTLETTTSGDIYLSGPIRLSPSELLISAADSLVLDSAIQGQLGTETLRAIAAARIDINESVTNLQTLSLQAADQIQTHAAIALNGNLLASAATIRIRADLSIAAAGEDGRIELIGGSLTQIASAAEILLGSGALHIEAAGGAVDLGDAAIRSLAQDAAVVIRDANAIVLGNVALPSGRIDVQTLPLISANIQQAAGTTIQSDSLVVQAGGSVSLANVGNDFVVIEDLRSGGDVDVVDSVGDLDIVKLVSLGSSVQIAAFASLNLLDQAIIASDATVRIDVGDAVVNSATDPNQPNLIARAVRLATVDGGIGQPGRAIQVIASAAVDADTSASGSDIHLANTSGALRVGRIDAAAGNIFLSATEIEDASDDSLPDLISRELTLLASRGIGADLPLELSAVQSLRAATTDGGIALNWTATADARIVSLKAQSGEISVALSGGSPLRIDSVTNVSGGISISNQDGSIEVIAAAAGASTIETTTDGAIALASDGRFVLAERALINAAQAVTIIAQDDVLLSGSIRAGGEIRVDSATTLEIGDDVQIVASQTNTQAVLLDAAEVRLGERFEIRTGEGVGVARHFLPRPELGVVDTAFFDFTSIETIALTQQNLNDAIGVLGLQVGRPGERGLQVVIDWGADTGRFQTIQGISADGGPLVVSHLYSERDLVTSRLNGRRAATDPLEVRFAVSHHESIVVKGSTITQRIDGLTRSETVNGGLLSSTDNPLTAMAPENGQAQFIIPNLSITVPFIPIPNIIPEPVLPEVVIRVPEASVVQSGMVETLPASASSPVLRDEYFRIRVLSSDPQGEDLIDPVRLPEDILSGDRLIRLFEQLPDGRYEIQYVLGDGRERSLLQVEIRGGRATVLSGDHQGGTLRLRPLPLDQWAELPLESEPESESEQQLDQRQPTEEDRELPPPRQQPTDNPLPQAQSDPDGVADPDADPDSEAGPHADTQPDAELHNQLQPQVEFGSDAESHGRWQGGVDGPLMDPATTILAVTPILVSLPATARFRRADRNHPSDGAAASSRRAAARCVQRLSIAGRYLARYQTASHSDTSR